ncbi:hypothetical protein [Streptomyces graminilatus]|uniref:hypothetical protein n=1 Tax=Streptomyces graminilatus TaxID=1464070 RepID=UPI0012FF3276|nr:hypothetical protein [Streptomyces graminilatus]
MTSEVSFRAAQAEADACVQRVTAQYRKGYPDSRLARQGPDTLTRTPRCSVPAGRRRRALGSIVSETAAREAALALRRGRSAARAADADQS